MCVLCWIFLAVIAVLSFVIVVVINLYKILKKEYKNLQYESSTRLSTLATAQEKLECAENARDSSHEQYVRECNNLERLQQKHKALQQRLLDFATTEYQPEFNKNKKG